MATHEAVLRVWDLVGSLLVPICAQIFILNPIDPKYTNSTTHLILIYAFKNEFLIGNWKLEIGN